MNTTETSKYIDGFSRDFSEFLTKMQKLMPCEEINKIIDKYPKLNKRKLIEKYHERTDKFADNIKKHDETLFNTSWYIIPEFDISFFWENLPEYRNDIWKILTKLSIYCSIIFNKQETRQSTPKLDIMALSSEIKKADDETKDGGNMMTQAVSKVKDVIGDAIDPEVSGVVTNLIDKIGADLKNVDFTKGNFMENIVGLAMKHPLELETNGKEIPIDKLLSSAQNLMKKMGLPSIDLQGMVEKAGEGNADAAMQQLQQLAQNFGLDMSKLPKLDANTPPEKLS